MVVRFLTTICMCQPSSMSKAMVTGTPIAMARVCKCRWREQVMTRNRSVSG
jgi:hypothetical protein